MLQEANTFWKRLIKEKHPNDYYDNLSLKYYQSRAARTVITKLNHLLYKWTNLGETYLDFKCVDRHYVVKIKDETPLRNILKGLNSKLPWREIIDILRDNTEISKKQYAQYAATIPVSFTNVPFRLNESDILISVTKRIIDVPYIIIFIYTDLTLNPEKEEGKLEYDYTVREGNTIKLPALFKQYVIQQGMSMRDIENIFKINPEYIDETDIFSFSPNKYE
jgi:hypothetical protein